MGNQAGNISLSILIGVVGSVGALTQFKAIKDSISELDRQRISAEGESQVLSNLVRYKGLLSSNGLNSFAIFPEPYLKANPELAQFSPTLAFQSSFDGKSQTVQLTQPQGRDLSEAQLNKIMSGTSLSANLCGDLGCPKTNIKLIRFNRDIGGPIPERIVSASVEVNAKVIDPKTNKPVEKKIIAQVPVEPPKVTSAILRLSGLKDSTASELAKVDLAEKQENVVVEVPEISAEIIVGGVAVAAEITIVEENKTFSSDDPDQFGLDQQGFPKHGAVSIRNQGSSLVKTPVFTVEDNKKYTIVGRIHSLDDHKLELRLTLDVNLPPPPDPAICSDKCKDKGKWYDGEFVGGAIGSYSTMVPGKWSCMFNQNGDWDKALGNPIFSFDPANDCKKDGPIGWRKSNMGCFVGETLIRMADGRYRPIADIVAGDKLWNPVLQRAVAVKRVVVGPEENKLVRITYAGRREMTVTPDHPFLDRFGGIVEARHLTSLITNEGLHSPVTLHWEDNNEKRSVFNLEMDAPESYRDAHFIDANGTIAGDLILQNQLHASSVEVLPLETARWSQVNINYEPLEL